MKIKKEYIFYTIGIICMILAFIADAFLKQFTNLGHHFIGMIFHMLYILGLILLSYFPIKTRSSRSLYLLSVGLIVVGILLLILTSSRSLGIPNAVPRILLISTVETGIIIAALTNAYSKSKIEKRTEVNSK